jgi:hypothetical protein
MVKSYVETSVQMIYDVLKDVWTFPCFIAETISRIDWDIPAKFCKDMRESEVNSIKRITEKVQIALKFLSAIKA